MFEEIVLASGNAGKLAEFSRWFAPGNIRVRSQAEFNVPECPEPHVTFIDNALAKARHASKYSGKPALADDSGICAYALGGAPGVYSARFAGSEPKSDAANNAKLSAELADQDDKRWCWCATKTTRNRLSPKAFGTGNGRNRPKAVTASATTRIFSCPNKAAPPQRSHLK